MTTTTGPDVQVSNASTGEIYPSQVLNEAARLDGAATDKRWTPNPDYYIPTHVATLLKPLTREQLDAEPTPEAGDHIPDTEDLRKQIDLTMASYRLVLHQEAKAELWHEIASEAWAHQGATSRISESYTAKRDALLAAYQRECEAIKAGLRGRPEYGGHVYDEQRGFVAAGPDEPAPQDLTPAERAIVDAATQRRKKLAQAAQGERAELPAPEPEGTVRASWWAQLAAWFGGATTRRRQTEQDGVE